jgi:hypothetical protein
MPFDLELEAAAAKMQKSDAPMAKADQYLQLKKFSNRQRLPGESEQQAFAKFIVQDPHGKQLYARYVQTRGVSVPVAKVDFNDLPSGHNPGHDGDPKRQTGGDADGIDGPPQDGESEHMRALRILAATLQAKHPAMSKQQSLAKAITTVEGARLYLLDRQLRLRQVA